MKSGGLAFNEDGVLPAGNYEFTFEQLRTSIFVERPEEQDKSWDTAWRRHLLNQAELLVNQLWQIGITEIYLDGSFVEMKNHPNDIDGYFECDLSLIASGWLERELNKLDQFKIWTWDPKSRKRYRGYTKKQLPMWHKYRVELYPHYGQPTGIKDKHGNDQLFPAAFRRSRITDQPKGIVKVVK